MFGDKQYANIEAICKELRRYYTPVLDNENGNPRAMSSRHCSNVFCVSRVVFLLRLLGVLPNICHTFDALEGRHRTQWTVTFRQIIVTRPAYF